MENGGWHAFEKTDSVGIFFSLVNILEEDGSKCFCLGAEESYLLSVSFSYCHLDSAKMDSSILIEPPKYRS